MRRQAFRDKIPIDCPFLTKYSVGTNPQQFQQLLFRVAGKHSVPLLVLRFHAE